MLNEDEYSKFRFLTRNLIQFHQLESRLAVDRALSADAHNTVGLALGVGDNG